MLPDYLDQGLKAIICGTAVGEVSARRGHYYAGPGNAFWFLLYTSGLTPRLLGPDEDARVTEFGLGLTDLVKTVAASSDHRLAPHYDVAGFLTKISQLDPTWVAFHGKEAGKQVSRTLGYGSHVRLGIQPWRIANSKVFVLPSASGANRSTRHLDGRASREDWFREFAALIQSS